MKVYITFGQIHIHFVNGRTFDKNCVAVINANSQLEGRELAFKYFSDKWHNSYTELVQVELSFYPRGLIKVN